MAGFTDTMEQQVLNLLFGKSPAFSVPTNWFVALSTTTPLEDGTNFTEPSGNNYSRVSTSAASWSAASGTAPAVLSNGSVITFPTPSGSWGTVTHFGLYVVSTTGTLYAWGALAASKSVGTSDVVSFAAAALQVKLGDPSDSY